MRYLQGCALVTVVEQMILIKLIFPRTKLTDGYVTGLRYELCNPVLLLERLLKYEEHVCVTETNAIPFNNRDGSFIGNIIY